VAFSIVDVVYPIERGPTSSAPDVSSRQRRGLSADDAIHVAVMQAR
jgi:hypothetical protein